VLARRLRLLRDAGQGPYRGLPPDAPQVPCQTWEPITVERIGNHSMRWRRQGGRPEGPEPYFVLRLGDAEHLCAVRLTLVHTAAGGTSAPLKVYWAHSAKDWFSEQRQWTTQVASSPDPQTVVVWINEDVDMLRVDPDETTQEIRVTGLEVLAAG
jgi:hypothetical protein